MAEYKSSRTGPGLVIFSAVVGLIFLSIAVGKFSFFRKERTLTLYFDSAGGLGEHAAVVYAGRKCGEVRRIRILQPNEFRRVVSPGKKAGTAMETNRYYVEITARVEAETPLHKDTKASIAMVGMLGDKLVELSPGDPEAPRLGADEPLYGENTGMEQLVATGRKLLDKLAGVTDNLGTLLTQVNTVMKDPKFQDDIKGTVANARSTLEKAGLTIAEARELLGENRESVKGALTNARELTAQGKAAMTTLQGTLDNVDHMTADLRPKLNLAADQAHATLQSADRALGQAHDTLKTADELLADNRDSLALTLTNLSQMGYNAKHFTHTLRLIFAPWSVFSQQKPPEKKSESGGKAKPPEIAGTNTAPANVTPVAETNAASSQPRPAPEQ